MAITELIFPSLKNDKASIEELERNWPTLSRQLITPNPGLHHAFRGWVVSEEDKDVRDEYKEFLLFEWNHEASFHNFVSGEQFATFAGMARPFLKGPPSLQLFDTNTSAKDIGHAAVVEIIRVRVSDAHSAKAALASWSELSQVVAEQSKTTCTVHGNSTNLEDSLFVGILGWASSEDQSAVSEQQAYQKRLASLGSVGGMSRIVVEVSPMDLPALEEA